MKKVMSLGLLSAVISSSAMAALPPYFQRSNELSAVLKSDNVHEAILDVRGKSSGMVDSIQHVESYEGGQKYLVTSGSCKLDVLVAYQASRGIAGPIKFKVFVEKGMTCSE